MCFALRLDSDVTSEKQVINSLIYEIFSNPAKVLHLIMQVIIILWCTNFKTLPKNPIFVMLWLIKKTQLILQFYSIFNLLNLFSLNEINLK